MIPAVPSGATEVTRFKWGGDAIPKPIPTMSSDIAIRSGELTIRTNNAKDAPTVEIIVHVSVRVKGLFPFATLLTIMGSINTGAPAGRRRRPDTRALMLRTFWKYKFAAKSAP